MKSVLWKVKVKSESEKCPLPVVGLQVKSAKCGNVTKHEKCPLKSESEKWKWKVSSARSRTPGKVCKMWKCNKTWKVDEYTAVIGQNFTSSLPWVISARCVADIVFREPIFILPPGKSKHWISLQFVGLAFSYVEIVTHDRLLKETNLLITKKILSVALLSGSPLLSGFAAQLWNCEVLLPMVGPVELTRRRLAGPGNRWDI